jgi:hypothetical protein
LGNQVQLRIQTATGEMFANMGHIGVSTWQVGDEVALIFWQNGRFCPRHITHSVDFGYLPTSERRRFIRRRLIKIVVWYFILVAMAIFLALYGQDRL